MKGDCGIWRRRGVREDRGAGMAKGEGGMVMRGDWGLGRVLVLALLREVVVSVEVVEAELLES